MRKTVWMWVLLLFVILSGSARGEETWAYRVEDGLAYITAYLGEETEVAVPREVDRIPVYGLDDGALPDFVEKAFLPASIGRIADTAISKETTVQAYHGTYALQWAGEHGRGKADLSEADFTSLVVDLTGSDYLKTEGGYSLGPALGKTLEDSMALYIPETGRAWGVNDIIPKGDRYLASVTEADPLLTYERVIITNKGIGKGVSLNSDGSATLSVNTGKAYRIPLLPQASAVGGISPVVTVRDLDIFIEVNVAELLGALTLTRPAFLLGWNLGSVLSGNPENMVDMNTAIREFHVSLQFDTGVQVAFPFYDSVAEIELSPKKGIRLGSTPFSLRPFGLLQYLASDRMSFEFGDENIAFTMDYSNKRGEGKLTGNFSAGTPYFRAEDIVSSTLSFSLGFELDCCEALSIGTGSYSWTFETKSEETFLENYEGTSRCRDVTWEASRGAVISFAPTLSSGAFDAGIFKIRGYLQKEFELADGTYLGGTIGMTNSINITHEFKRTRMDLTRTINNYLLDSGETAHFEKDRTGGWVKVDECRRRHALHFDPGLEELEPYTVDCSVFETGSDWANQNDQPTWPGKSFEGWYTEEGDRFFDSYQEPDSAYNPLNWSGTMELTGRWTDLNTNVYPDKYYYYSDTDLTSIMCGQIFSEIYITDPDGVEREYYYYNVKNMENIVQSIDDDYDALSAPALRERYRDLAGYNWFVTFDPEAEGRCRKVPEYRNHRAMISGANSAALEKVVLHSRVYRTRDFNNCPNLKTFTGNGHLLELATFVDCPKLETVTGIQGLKEIKEYGFANCYSLMNITLPSTLESIGQYAFANCASLPSVTIPSGVSTIERGAFYNCASLTSLDLNSVVRIEEYAFKGTSNLETVRISSENSLYVDDAFEKSGVREMTLSAGGELEPYGLSDMRNLETLTITAGKAKGIGLSGLSRLKNLTVQVNDSVDFLTISGCPVLETVILEIPNLGDLWVDNCPALGELNVAGSVTCGQLDVRSCSGLETLIVGGRLEQAAVWNCPLLKVLQLGPVSAGSNGKTILDLYSLNSLETFELADGETYQDASCTLSFTACPRLTEIIVPLDTDISKIRISSSCPAVIRRRAGSVGTGEATALMHFTGSYGMENPDLWLVPGSEFRIFQPNPVNWPDSYYRSFLGWRLNGDRDRLLQPGDSIIVPEGESTLYAEYEHSFYSMDIRDGTLYGYVRYGLDSCTALTVPDEITGLEENCVSETDTSVLIGRNVRSIHPLAFAKAESLQTIEVDPGNPYYEAADGILYGKDGTLLAVPAGTLLSEYTVPEGTGKIAAHAFNGEVCGRLGSVEIPDSVAAFGEEWYAGITGCPVYGPTEGPVADAAAAANLRYNVFPVYFISENFCVAVGAAQAGSELPPVRNLRGDGTFKGWCLSETGPVISDPIIVPYGGLILYARWLTTPPPYTDFLLPDSLENAGEEAFAGLSLRSVRVPATVKEIGPRAFADCGSLKVVYFEGWDTSIHETAFENAPADLVFYGFADSTAAGFAAENNIAFIALDR